MERTQNHVDRKSHTFWVHIDKSQSILAKGIGTLPVNLARSKFILLGCWSQRLRLNSILKVQPTGTESQSRTSHGLDGNGTNKSPQLRPLPYFCLMGSNNRRALSKLVLSGHDRSGSNLRKMERMKSNPRVRERR